MRRLVGAASIGAGLLHAGLAPAHFAEWWGYGVFSLAAAAAQGVYGLTLVTSAFGDGPENARAWRLAYFAGAVGTLFLIALYVLSRTVGVPLLGPSTGRAEPVAPLDLFTKGLEAIAAGGSILLYKT